MMKMMDAYDGAYECLLNPAWNADQQVQECCPSTNNLSYYKSFVDKFDNFWINQFKFIFNRNYTQNNFRILITNEKCLHHGQFEFFS